MQSTESDIELDSNEIITSKTFVCTVRYYYDAEDNLIRKRIKFADGKEHTVLYEQAENDSQVVKFTAGGKTVASHSKNDSFGRKVFDELQLSTGFISRQFSYHAGEVTKEHVDNNMLKSSPTTQLVSQIVLSGGRTISYEYDKEERITKVDDSIDGITEYTYDALGQLVAETKDNQTVNQMTYDNYGNILTKNGVVYDYDTVWKDKLIKVGDKTITYDEQGNPLTYLGHTLTWEKGRQLKSFDNIQYTYNANGIRTSKTVDNIRHDYVLDGAKILREGWNFDETINTYRDILVPLYDNEDSVCGIEYNGASYYFLKNLQGDVIAITDSSGEEVARYTYDAWGKVTVFDTNGVDITERTTHIANINPFRYRSYYFDLESGLYYLQSRYYDPQVGRFVGIDKYMGSNDDHSAYALYTYCGNCPVDRYDKNGFFWKKVWNGIKNSVRTTLNKTNKVLVQLGMDTAAIGAWFLNMNKDKHGVYHAKFNCWQQYFGYNDFYDFMFDIGTSMKNEKFIFKSGKKSYILWAWKGNYINLGAGAELGIYYGGGPHWLVDKKLAMNMSMELRYKSKRIISYSTKTWWITGFNPNPQYLNAKASDLKASFTVKFNNIAMYNSFKSAWRRKWACSDKLKTASHTF